MSKNKGKKFAAFNRQGIRDLNNLPGKSVGRKIDLPNEADECKHQHVKYDDYSGNTTCICGAKWDFDSRPI